MPILRCHFRFKVIYRYNYDVDGGNGILRDSGGSSRLTKPLLEDYSWAKIAHVYTQALKSQRYTDGEY